MGILPWLAGALSSLFSSSVVRFMAMKVILTALFVTILPIILNNFAYKLIDIALSFLTGVSSPQSFVLNVAGLGAFFADHLNLVPAINVIIAALVTRFTLKLVPFVRT